MRRMSNEAQSQMRSTVEMTLIGAEDEREVIIEDNAYIGAGAIILYDVKIG